MSTVPLWLTGGRAIEVREATDVIDQKHLFEDH